MLIITDSNGPTGLLIDGEKDSVCLLALGFLRTRSLQDYDKIARPFSKIRTISFPWTSAGFSAAHVASMPSMLASLRSLTRLLFIAVVQQKESKYCDNRHILVRFFSKQEQKVKPYPSELERSVSPEAVMVAFRRP